MTFYVFWIAAHEFWVDKHWDRQTHHDSTYRASIASRRSRGKNLAQDQDYFDVWFQGQDQDQ